MASFILEGLTTEELRQYRRKLQDVLLSGVRQATFQGQTVIFRNKEDVLEELNRVGDKIFECENPGKSAKGKTKRIVLSARKNRGF